MNVNWFYDEIAFVRLVLDKTFARLKRARHKRLLRSRSTP